MPWETFPEITLRAAAVTPPTVLQQEPNWIAIPTPPLASLVPATSRPTLFPWTRCPTVVPPSEIPSPVLPDTRFPAPGSVPPIVLPEGKLDCPSSVIPIPFGTDDVPAAFVPT